MWIFGVGWGVLGRRVYVKVLWWEGFGILEESLLFVFLSLVIVCYLIFRVVMCGFVLFLRL